MSKVTQRFEGAKLYRGEKRSVPLTKRLHGMLELVPSGNLSIKHGRPELVAFIYRTAG
jgi:hypothetical protein